MDKKKLITFFLPSLEGGGAERVILNLIKGFVEKGLKVQLLLLTVKGPFLKEIPEGCEVINLKVNRARESFFRFRNYLKLNKPLVLISGLSHLNVVALFVSLFIKSNAHFIVVEHNSLSQKSKNSRSFLGKVMPILMFLTYWRAVKVIAVSEGVAKDLERRIPYLKGKVEVVYNPIFSNEILIKSTEQVEHPWFKDNATPIIISVGRLALQKDYTTLIKAFAKIREKLLCHLVILGEGEERENLENLAKHSGIYEDIWMPGFVENPYKYMNRASVFVLSSKYEGFPTVLVEAMAVGVPIVSTNCESGPSEILDNGKYGKLVPVGNFEEMANAILEILSSRLDKSVLQKRATFFNIESSVRNYLKIMDMIKDEHKGA